MSNTSSLPRERPSKTGVVTFLDILGWKGIYNRENDPIAKLNKLVNSINSYKPRVRGSADPPTVHSISDTIVMYNQAVELTQVSRVIDAHGEICAHAIANSIASHIPIRGATAFGDFDARDSNYVGKAIDEAASWYEMGDWVGVHLTPSAKFAIDNSPLKHWRDYQAPLKIPYTHSMPCVAWDSAWERVNAKFESMKQLKSVFLRMGPITPDIAVKFGNTIKYYEWLLQQRRSSSADLTGDHTMHGDRSE